MIAPPAPSAAAGVGLVIPPRIEPRTATIRTSGGKTTRISSFLAQHWPQSTAIQRMATRDQHQDHSTPARCVGRSADIHQQASTTPMPPIINRTRSREGDTPRAVVRIKRSRSARIAMPVPMGAARDSCCNAAAHLFAQTFGLLRHRLRLRFRLLRQCRIPARLTVQIDHRSLALSLTLVRRLRLRRCQRSWTRQCWLPTMPRLPNRSARQSDRPARPRNHVNASPRVTVLRW